MIERDGFIIDEYSGHVIDQVYDYSPTLSKQDGHVIFATITTPTNKIHAYHLSDHAYLLYVAVTKLADRLQDLHIPTPPVVKQNIRKVIKWLSGTPLQHSDPIQTVASWEQVKNSKKHVSTMVNMLAIALVGYWMAGIAVDPFTISSILGVPASEVFSAFFKIKKMVKQKGYSDIPPKERAIQYANFLARYLGLDPVAMTDIAMRVYEKGLPPKTSPRLVAAGMLILTYGKGVRKHIARFYGGASLTKAVERVRKYYL